MILELLFLADTLYWNHIKNPQRLQMIKQDTTVSGKVTKIYRERDGDLHVYVQTAKQLLNVEIICYNPKNATICNGYKNTIAKPKIGQTIYVKGDFVKDKHHNWVEIHPVKAIKIK